jgi:thiamine pyrophosphokinase
MEADSIDVSGIDAMMDEFSAEVADAKDSLEAGDFDSASSGLKEAYNTLKQIVSSIKELGGK